MEVLFKVVSNQTLGGIFFTHVHTKTKNWLNNEMR